MVDIIIVPWDLVFAIAIPLGIICAIVFLREIQLFKLVEILFGERKREGE